MLTSLLIGVLVFILLALTIAPLDALGWWSSKGADEAAQTVQEILVEDDGDDTPEPFEHYIVYLSGIGAIDGHSIPEEELPLVDALKALPDTCVVSDVFPYSVTNKGLTGQRTLSWLWRRIEQARLKKPEALAGMLVNGRNAMQLFVSSDRRYGPAYNLGTAREVVQALRRQGYQLDGGKPVTLIGWSGGAQISIGAAWYLGMGKIPLRVVSIGGMMSDDPGLARVDHLWHLRGSKDVFEKLGGVMFAGRWPRAAFSPWSDALKDERIDIVELGPMHHNGKEHYFDTLTAAPDGRTYLQVTIDAVIAVLTNQRVKTIPAGSPARHVDS
jgi:pimeloyl-ACP methyl ester carboxylesterase